VPRRVAAMVNGRGWLRTFIGRMLGSNASIKIKAALSLVAGPTHWLGALPPNRGMERTGQTLTQGFLSDGEDIA
jgi:hypothetical protein